MSDDKGVVSDPQRIRPTIAEIEAMEPEGEDGRYTPAQIAMIAEALPPETITAFADALRVICVEDNWEGLSDGGGYGHHERASGEADDPSCRRSQAMGLRRRVGIEPDDPRPFKS